MFCKYCGEQLDDKILEEKHIAYCGKCGKVNKKADAESQTYETKVYTKDSGSVGWGVLGFFFPLVGLVLYLCWIRTSPRSANAAGAGALISVVLEILIALVFVILSLFTNIQLPAEFYY